MRPLLAFGADGQEKNINEAIDALANQFRLTPEDRKLLLPSGKQTVLANRVHWARTYLDKARALTRTRRSHFVVTDRGRDLLKQYPERVDARALRKFPEFVAFQTVRPESSETEVPAQPETPAAPEVSSATLKSSFRPPKGIFRQGSKLNFLSASKSCRQLFSSVSSSISSYRWDTAGHAAV
jgi:restriction system protein